VYKMMKNNQTIIVIALLLALATVMFGADTSAHDYVGVSLTVNTPITYCGGAYSSGDWNITSTTTCSDEVIPIDGNLNILSTSEIPEDHFTEIPGVYDLTANSSTIASAIPPVDISMPAEHTNNWDADPNDEFYITMNESENKIQMVTNNTDSLTKAYLIDLDGSDTSGSAGLNHADFGFGYLTDAGGLFMICYNETIDDFDFYDLSLGSGQVSCDSSFDSNLQRNATIYWNTSGNSMAVTVVTDGAWIDKKIYSYDGTTLKSTKFKNTPAVIGTNGVLNLNNVTLNMTNGSISVDGKLNANDSRIIMNLDNSSLHFSKFSSANINRTDIYSEIPSNRYSFFVQTPDFALDNAFVNNIGDTHIELGIDIGGIVLYTTGNGGLINNVTYGDEESNYGLAILLSQDITVTNSNLMNTSGIIAGVDTGLDIEDNYIPFIFLGNENSNNIFKIIT